MAKRKLISHDYKDELASIVEEKGFGNEAENLIINMFYIIEESYPNYNNVPVLLYIGGKWSWLIYQEIQFSH